ncbi:MAG TPA: hypothetical protein VI873_05015 [Candidatus Peribacteraceae bacterium]|nr:hypothetical protein [Candidatus Peribacteraceae bacterium]
MSCVSDSMAYAIGIIMQKFPMSAWKMNPAESNALSRIEAAGL